MFKLNIKDALPKAYTHVSDKLSEASVENKVVSWSYKKPVFTIIPVEGVDLTEFIQDLVLLVDGKLEGEEVTEPAPEPIEATAPALEEVKVVEAEPEPTVVVEPEPVIVAPVRPPKPAPKMYEARIFTCYPGTYKDPAVEEVVESRDRPWTMMVYKKFNDTRKGKYPSFVARVEVWFDGALIDMYPPISPM